MNNFFKQAHGILRQRKNHIWLNKCPCYNTAICSKLHGTLFENYISYDIIEKYNIMCFINAYYKLLPTYVDDANSRDDRAILKNATTE